MNTSEDIKPISYIMMKLIILSENEIEKNNISTHDEVFAKIAKKFSGND